MKSTDKIRPNLTKMGSFISVFFAVVIFQSGLFAQSVSSGLDQSEFSDLRQWVSLHEDLRRQIDRVFIDPEHTIETNNYDASAIHQFVATQIAFQQYPGLLRGSKGTLQTRAGNSLDQAILLANLLKDAGYEAQIAYSQIDLEMAKSLVNQVKNPTGTTPIYRKSAVPVLVEIAEFLESRVPSGEPTDTDWDSKIAKNRELAEGITQAISQALTTRGISLGSQDQMQSIVEEARDYFWCQYRDGPAAEWIDAHPVFENVPTKIGALKPEKVYVDSVPTELQQQISFQLFASRQVGGKPEQTALTALWTRPVANVYASPVTFSIVPSQAAAAAGDDYDINSDTFLPYLNGSIAPGAKAFDLNGNFVPADAALSNMAGVFKTVSDKGISAATALQALGSSGDNPGKRAMSLEDVWLEISLKIGGVDSEQVIRRSFRSNAGSEPPTGNSLARRVNFSLAPGSLSTAPAYDQILKLHIEALKLTLNQQLSSASGAVGNLGGNGSSQYEIDYATLEGITEFLSLLDIIDPLSNQNISYRSQPLVIARHDSIASDSGEPVGIDIIYNSRRSFTLNPEGQLTILPGTTLEAGVAETVAEHLVMENRGEKVVNAVVKSSSMINGQPPTVIANLADMQDLAEQGSNLPARMKISLERGRIVILPNQKEADIEIDAWWEIDPRTGRTLGLTSNGWGGSYFQISTTASENLITRRIVIGVSCMMIVGTSCRMYSQTAVAAIAVGISGLGWASCKLLFLASPLSNLPPGIPDVCDAIKRGPTYVKRALRGAEKFLYETCYKKALPECVKAAVAGG